MEQRTPSRQVVVGLDGSGNADHALRWAVDKASILGTVTPVIVTPPSSPGGSVRRTGAETTAGREAAEALMWRALDGVDSELVCSGLVVEGHPGQGLIEAAANAELLVVGTRGQSGLASTLLGSVSSLCATTAEIPVAVIPLECPTDRPLLDIVVGVDGSDHADAALRWAIEHLAPGGRLRAVGGLPIWGDVEDGSVSTEQRLGDRVKASIDRVLADVSFDDGGEREIIITTAPRDARVVLRDAADGADLLVIGRRGLSRLAFLIVGSVAAAMIHHPTVPTVVIPAGEKPRPEDATGRKVKR